MAGMIINRYISHNDAMEKLESFLGDEKIMDVHVKIWEEEGNFDVEIYSYVQLVEQDVLTIETAYNEPDARKLAKNLIKKLRTWADEIKMDSDEKVNVLVSKKEILHGYN